MRKEMKRVKNTKRKHKALDHASQFSLIELHIYNSQKNFFATRIQVHLARLMFNFMHARSCFSFLCYLNFLLSYVCLQQTLYLTLICSLC